MGAFEHNQNDQCDKKSCEKQHWNDDQFHFIKKHPCKGNRDKMGLESLIFLCYMLACFGHIELRLCHIDT